MKKLLCSILACLMLAGCAAPGGTSSSGSASSGGASSSAVDQSTPAPPAKKFKAEPIDFTWKPVVYSDYQRQARAPEAEDFYRNCVEAMMKGETTVPCTEELVADLLPIMQYIFPVVNGILFNFEYRDGALQITYSVSDAEREQIIDEFGRRIEELVEQSVCKGDTPTMAAIALYHSLASGVNYDYEALDQGKQDGSMDVTPYRALMTGEGICQSFGPAYAYLCMQLGINAIEADGWDYNEENGHSWTMLELNGHHYFADPTFENGSGGGGLRYFGMSSDRRAEDNYLLKDVGLGFNLMQAEEFDLSDDTFAPLWDVQNIYEICRTESGMEIRGHIYYPAQRAISIEDGKHLLVTPCDSDGNSLDTGDTSMPEEPSDSTPADVYSPIPESMQGTAWSSAGFDVAFVSPSTVWVDSTDYTGMGQCWISAEGQLTMELPTGELEIHQENDERLILKGKNGEFPATKDDSMDLYLQLFDQMIAAREEENAVG